MEKRSQPKINSKVNTCIVLLALVLSFAAVFPTFKNIKFAANADEGYYLKYADRISQEGLGSFPGLFEDYTQNQQHWLFPNPLRVGFIILSSLWLKVFGSSLLNLAYLSLACFYIFLLFAYYFSRKYFGDDLAALLTVLLAFSPLNMAMARRALMDSASNLFMLLSVWLFLESIKQGKARKTVLFILVYSFTILIKESSILLSVFFAPYILLRALIYKKPFSLKDFLSVTIIPLGIVGITYIIASGSLSLVADTAEIILNSPKSNQYALLFGSGPWFRYLVDWILLSPWVAILAIAFSLHYIMQDKKQEEVSYLILLSVSLIFLFSFFTKNIRYLIILDMPIRLFAILMLNELTGRIFKNRSLKILFTFIILIAFFDYLRFNNLFLQNDIYDPISYLLLKATHIVPFK